MTQTTATATVDELETIYREANAAHLAVAAEIGRTYPTPSRGSALGMAFSSTHEARRIAFFAVVEARRSA